MDIGAFSLSINVKDIHASYDFYQKIGFIKFAGDIDQNWLILKNGDTIIGIFQGMIEKNTLTFNPGWDKNTNEVTPYTDIREIQKQLKAKGISSVTEIDETSSGPVNMAVLDPDGNPILFDQHV